MTSLGAFHEDLLWQAHRGRELGQALCKCEGRYHWSYGILRAAGVTNSLAGEEPLLASLMSPLIGERARVMIGGCADPGLFCVVGRLSAARRPEITVVDKCRAPLALIEEFAARRMLACRTLHGDLLAFDGREQWDMIFLHYTPDFVDGSSRQQFFEALAASLVPGGVLVCASMTGQRIPIDRRQDAADAFRAYSLKALRESPMAAHEEDPEFVRMLGDYAAACSARRMAYPDKDELRRLLHGAGLRIVSQHMTPRRWHFFKIDAGTELDTSSVIIAKKD